MRQPTRQEKLSELELTEGQELAKKGKGAKMNRFINSTTSHDGRTQNNAVSHSTSGNPVLDYFYKMGTFRGRSYVDVVADLSKAWDENPVDTLKTIFYNRIITRKSKGLFSTEKVQKGGGNKDEFVKALQWLESTHPETLRKNLWLVPVVGCWKDLWYHSSSTGYNHYLMPESVYKLVGLALQDEFNRGLLAKYLPKFRSSSNTKNDRHRKLNKWIHGLCSHLGWTLVDYRKFKSDPSNTSHLWQRQMTANMWEQIDFNRIPGKALFNLISQKGKDKKTALERHGLVEKYTEWIKSQPIVPFTGYPYELFNKAKLVSGHFYAQEMSLIEKLTYNKQFEGLLQKAKKDQGGLEGNVWCALDCSGSMGMPVALNTNPGLSALDVCLSLGIYFSGLNEGAFKNHVIRFDSTSKVEELRGTFTDKVAQTMSMNSMGSTNFQSVIDEIVRIRKSRPDVPIEDYPETLLVVSDMQFNPAGGHAYYSSAYQDYTSESYNIQLKTNYEMAMEKLEAVGLPRIQVIWWNVNTAYGKDVPAKAGDEGVSLMSGFDGSIISTILGGEAAQKKFNKKATELSPQETMELALDQEVLNQLDVV